MKQSKAFSSGFSVEETIESLRQQLAEKDAEIAQWKANSSENKWIAEECARREQELRQQLAASQAREVQLRDALELVANRFIGWHTAAVNALTTPSDTSAIEAMIAKAGEVMRERCERESWLMAPVLRSIHGVTLEDLRK